MGVASAGAALSFPPLMPRPHHPLRLLLAALLLALASRLPAQEPPLRVMMEHASPPFTYLDDRGQPTGFAVELMRAIAAEVS